MTEEELEARWGDIELYGVPTGLDQCMIAVWPEDQEVDLPDSRVPLTLHVSHAVMTKLLEVHHTLQLVEAGVEGAIETFEEGVEALEEGADALSEATEDVLAQVNAEGAEIKGIKLQKKKTKGTLKRGTPRE